ncbi:MAG TPA: hypothetical protein GXX51_06885 [Firmicutes bacterium]|nr:hypothetical protein [Bacillota bacterium]
MAVEQAVAITQGLIERKMQEVLQSDFDPREFRLSESGACPRKRVARVLGYPAEEPDEEDAAYFERGNIVEAWVVSLYREAFPRRCRTQVEVRTPTGEVGHIDLWFPAEKRIVEVKSVSIGARELPRPEHVAQVQAYLHFFRNSRGERKAENAEIVYIKWGAGLQSEVFPIMYDPVQGEKIEQELRRLHEYRDRGELPPLPRDAKPEAYPCSWRNRAGQVKCPYWSMCWTDAKNLPPLDGEAMADKVTRYAEICEKLRAAKAVVDDLEGAKRLLEQYFSPVMDASGADALRASGYLLKRTKIAGHISYDVKAAIAAGVVSEQALEPFKKESAGSFRWSLRKEK